MILAGDVSGLARAAAAGHKRAIGRLISVFEDSRPDAAARRKDILAALAALGPPRARFMGVTGTPGAGKSTLIGALARMLVERDARANVAVLAVDPSSHISGGALLGDRTRVHFPAGEARLFFRSQAAERELGGMGRHTFAVCRLLRYLFDYIFVETVGIGQSEIEIGYLADTTYLVLQPLAGDEVQFMKAGIMEIPDVLVLNKCDEAAAAEASYQALRASLRLARLERAGMEPPPILRVSARTGAGVAEMVDGIVAGDRSKPRAWAEKEGHFFTRWLQAELGRAGLRMLAAYGGAQTYIERAGSYDDAQEYAWSDFARWVAQQEPGPA